ncbi:MAG: hypothetical protein ACYSO4_05250, partial [Planctomycetota bacterium]
MSQHPMAFKDGILSGGTMQQSWIKCLFGMLIVGVAGLCATVQADESSFEGKVIESLEVTGNVTLTRAEVLSVVRARSGQPYNTQTV